MLLEGKNAVVFAASGAIASQVARRLAGEGAVVWLSARRGDAVKELAEEINASGGQAHAQEVDALSPEAVEAYLETVAAAGSVDIVFNGIGVAPSEMGFPAKTVDQDLDAFLYPMRLIVGSQFLTTREAAKHMGRRGTGSIITVSSALTTLSIPYQAGVCAASAAVESMTRSLAAEYGSSGIRINCVRGSAMPETRTIQETRAGHARLGTKSTLASNALGRPLTVDDTAGAVTFLASSLAAGLCGQVLAL
ncbi:MAG TPA: SDR family oxidoreductase [Streptosporangiaceae bacterium]|nr:SDR family oxidoreductase [Streptosporangiaceae bacterium]